MWTTVERGTWQALLESGSGGGEVSPKARGIEVLRAGEKSGVLTAPGTILGVLAGGAAWSACPGYCCSTGSMHP